LRWVLADTIPFLFIVNFMKSKKPLIILGFQNYANHDSGACLFRIDESNEEIRYVAISEERLNRKKYSYFFPAHSIKYCMDALGIESVKEIDMVVGDWARIKRWHNSGPAYRKAEFDYIKLKLNIPPEKFYQVPYHHDAHAASAFYPSGFKEAAILTVDGTGSDLETQNIYYGKGDRIIPLEKGLESGIGKAYNWIGCKVLPFDRNEAPGKVMGLAPYGEKYKMKVINFQPKYDGIHTDYTELFSRLPYVKLRPSALKSAKDQKDALKPYFARAAYEIQEECERAMLHLARRAYQLTKSKNICLAGGVALNSVANKKILDQAPFENIYIQPASSDSGLPLGLCLYAYYMIDKSRPKKRFIMPNAYTGVSYNKKEIKQLLDSKKFSYTEIGEQVAGVAKLIAKNYIVGWLRGGSEYGPRALGARSILANATHPKMKEILNERVKHRESFRPFAPAVLEEDADEYFELNGYPSPYMLLVAKVKKNKQKVVPAITHVDGTARVQTVNRLQNALYYDLISEFKKLTGVPVILNTSYNVAGEPIVETPRDALITFLGTNIDYLYLEGYLISKKKNKKRAAGIREELLQERAADLERDYSHIVTKVLCRGYKKEEIQPYVDEDNKIANWWRDYRSKYELEKAAHRWLKDKSKILIIGSKNKTKLLYEYINEFADLNVVGAYYPIKEADHSGKWEAPFQKYKVLTSRQLKRASCDILLIASYRYQNQLAEQYGPLLKSKEVYKIYDNASEDLLFVLPNKWPKYREALADK